VQTAEAVVGLQSLGRFGEEHIEYLVATLSSSLASRGNSLAWIGSLQRHQPNGGFQ
jgi:hypothetical protein